eukprot:scaffold24352_cov13-Tisochrysis_lutea.AAC.1
MLRCVGQAGRQLSVSNKAGGVEGRVSCTHTCTAFADLSKPPFASPQLCLAFDSAQCKVCLATCSVLKGHWTLISYGSLCLQAHDRSAVNPVSLQERATIISSLASHSGITVCGPGFPRALHQAVTEMMSTLKGMLSST